MTSYDLSRLNDKEFETLCGDLLSAREGVKFERFKPGRDSGVDGRFQAAQGKEWIIQCKHWASSPIETLVRYLKKTEAPKVEKLQPSRYFICLSHSLSRNEKSNISEIFAPYITSTADILGKEDLTDLIAAHTDIERKHYKLWLSSSNVLTHILNKSIYDRSNFLIEETVESSHKYVYTKSHSLAASKIKELNVVIITGVAGIGKTTLASHIALEMNIDGYELFCIADDISEAEKVFGEDKRQLFYFDDFLGRNYLEALTGHEGSQIVQFIRRVRKSKDKKFILTSRTTILNQGKSLIDALTHNNLDKNELEITIQSLTEMDRARILYNHLWHSSLNEDFIDKIYEDKKYKAIISHRNYNPRLISFITDYERIADLEPSDYWNYISEMLQNPADVWDNSFTAQLDDFGRTLVLLVALNGRAIDESILAESYSRYLGLGGSNGFTGRRDFLVNIKHLSGSLLTRVAYSTGNTASLNLFNPSIGDYVVRRYKSDLPTIRTVFRCLRTVSSVGNLVDLFQNEILSQTSTIEILKRILKDAHDVNYIGYPPEYIGKLQMSLLRLNKFEVAGLPEDISSAAYLAGCDLPSDFEDILAYLAASRSRSLIDAKGTEPVIERALKGNPTVEEIRQLVRLISSVEDPEIYLNEATEAATAHFVSSVHDEFLDEDVFDGLGQSESEKAEWKLRELIGHKFSDLGLECPEHEVDNIIESFDIDERIVEYFHYKPDDQDDLRADQAYIPDEIDDLFERTR